MKRRPLVVAGSALALVLLAALVVAWLVRFRVATVVVDRRLAAAGVPAGYRLTKIGPFLERMEDVRIGAPAAPDLRARRIDVTIGYGLSGPFVRRIAVDGVRLRGRYDARGLHLGALDRLLPKSGGKAGLPDMPLSIRDAQVALATPYGPVSAVIAGEGNPARAFDGSARLAALSLRVAGCAARDVTAALAIAVKDGTPQATGPLRASGLGCPAQRLAVGQSAARIILRSDAAFRRLDLDANVATAAGQVRDVRASGMKAVLSGSWSPSGFGGAMRLDLRSVTAPPYADAVARLAEVAAGTPVDPLTRHVATGMAALLRRADVTAELAVAGGGKAPVALRLRRVEAGGASGAHVAATEGQGIVWTSQGMRLDGMVETSGGGLPTLALRLEQAQAGGPLAGVAVVQPYGVGRARFASSPIRFRWDGRRGAFAAVPTISGPFAGGFVEGLSTPVRGYVTSDGAFVVGAGCQDVAFARLRVSSFTFAGARMPVCGRPLVARTAAGQVRVDLATGPLRLAGRSDDGVPVTAAAGGLRLNRAGFTGRDIAVTLGGGDRPTRLALAAIDGVIGRTIHGRFAGAAGAIANVPLNIADAAGRWSLEDGALRLAGRLGVSDAGEAARFNPLVTDDARLDLRDGAIRASATLREPTTNAVVMTARLEHRLSGGRGHAAFDMPGITFTPKGLQPERLTPLTLGVIANVAGTITGRGRIDWGPGGVTSSGDFATDRIDLAAVFGPVKGISGRLRFTDLLGLVSAPDQQASVAEINPGVAVTNGIVRYRLIGGNRVAVDGAEWPFAGGTLRLEPTTLDFGKEAERRMTFRIAGLDAAAFVQQLDFPNISTTGTFDGVLPMIFDQAGGRIEGGEIVARRDGGTIAYVGELSNAQLGTMGKLAFDALKAIRYSALDISLDGRLDGEMVSRVRFTGVREATPEQSMMTRLIRNLPFRFNIGIRAPFRGLVGSARAYIDPRLLLTQVPPPPPAPVQPPASGDAR